MWSFDEYYADYLELCEVHKVVPYPRSHMAQKVPIGADPKDAFAFFDHPNKGVTDSGADGVPRVVFRGPVQTAPPRASVMLSAEGYDLLADVFRRAFDQAATGKGAERHADSKPFDEQPMQLIAQKRGIGFILGQADKKSEEAQGMLNRGQKEACIKELLGSMVYLAGAVIFIEKNL